MQFLAVGNGRVSSSLETLFGDGDGPRPGPREGEFEVCVILTSEEATLAALRQAAVLAKPISARLRLLVPELVPFPLPVDRPPVAPEVMEARLLTLVARAGVETSIDIRLCREPVKPVSAALAPRSLVVIGGRGRWPLARERRMAASLRRQGHTVFLAEPE
jgi:hypothetical protein